MSRRSSCLADPRPEAELGAEPLGVAQIERELEVVAAALIPGHEPGDDAALRPRAISAAELARRVRPFLGWN